VLPPITGEVFVDPSSLASVGVVARVSELTVVSGVVVPMVVAFVSKLIIAISLTLAVTNVSVTGLVGPIGKIKVIV